MLTKRKSLYSLMIMLVVSNQVLFAEPLKNFWDNTSSWVKYSVAVVGGYYLLNLQKKNNQGASSVNSIKARNLRKSSSDLKEIDLPFHTIEETKPSAYANFENNSIFELRKSHDNLGNFESLHDSKKNSHYFWPFLSHESKFSKPQSQSHTGTTLVDLIMNLILQKQEEEIDIYPDFLNKILSQNKK